MTTIEVTGLERGRAGPYFPFSRTLLLSVKRAPPDYLFCSIFTFSYMNCCCLGLLALLFSIKSRDCKVIGDPEGAEDHGKTARCLNVVAVTLAIFAFIIFIILLATSAAFFYNALQEMLAEIHDNATSKP